MEVEAGATVGTVAAPLAALAMISSAVRARHVRECLPDELTAVSAGISSVGGNAIGGDGGDGGDTDVDSGFVGSDGHDGASTIDEGFIIPIF